MKYIIYQLDTNKKEVRNSHRLFENWNWLNKYDGGFDFSLYKEVYSEEVDDDKVFGQKIISFLDELFEKFNLNHPLDFHGHSLSVSDVIWISDKPENLYYCDSIGWKEIKKVC